LTAGVHEGTRTAKRMNSGASPLPADPECTPSRRRALRADPPGPRPLSRKEGKGRSCKKKRILEGGGHLLPSKGEGEAVLTGRFSVQPARQGAARATSLNPQEDLPACPRYTSHNGRFLAGRRESSHRRHPGGLGSSTSAPTRARRTEVRGSGSGFGQVPHLRALRGTIVQVPGPPAASRVPAPHRYGFRVTGVAGLSGLPELRG